MEKPTTNVLNVEGRRVFIHLFCLCGWVTTVKESGASVCENPRCELFGQVFNVSVAVAARDRTQGIYV